MRGRSLFNRLVMAAQLLDAADAAGEPGLSACLSHVLALMHAGMQRNACMPAAQLGQRAWACRPRSQRTVARKPLALPAPILHAGPAGMGFFFTWLRLSTMRQLDWCALRGA